MLEDYKIKVFDTVCRTRSFTRAAQYLDITQPAVSQNIAELERMLGATLFVRGRSEVSLTPEGEQFRTYSDRILYWCSLAEAKFMHTESPGLRQSTLLELGGGNQAEIYVEDGALNIRFNK